MADFSNEIDTIKRQIENIENELKYGCNYINDTDISDTFNKIFNKLTSIDGELKSIDFDVQKARQEETDELKPFEKIQKETKSIDLKHVSNNQHTKHDNSEDNIKFKKGGY